MKRLGGWSQLSEDWNSNCQRVWLIMQMLTRMVDVELGACAFIFWALMCLGPAGYILLYLPRCLSEMNLCINKGDI